MDDARFLRLCPMLWHVAAPGTAKRIRLHGMRTAQQCIDAAIGLSEEERTQLADVPRRSHVELEVDGDTVVLRDQGPLFRRKDLTAVLGEGMTTADWVRMLNDRVYFFRSPSERKKVADKYALLDGSQEVLTIDTRRLLEVARDRLEIATQNTGALRHEKGRYKFRDTFMPVALVPQDEKPERLKEITVRGGLSAEEAGAVIAGVEEHRV